MEITVKYANQRILSPMQINFWSNYINKDLDTFGNAYKSAIVVGYTHESAKNVTRKEWFRHGESFYHELLSKAEEVLWEDLNMDIWEDIRYRGKKTGERRINPNLARIRSEIAKFVCLTIGKKKYNRKPYQEKYDQRIVLSNPVLDELFREGDKSTLKPIK